MNLPYFILGNNKEFTNAYEFINCENPSQKLINELKVTKFPQILMLNKSEDPNNKNAQIAMVQGDLSYSNIWQFTYSVRSLNNNSSK